MKRTFPSGVAVARLLLAPGPAWMGVLAFAATGCGSVHGTGDHKVAPGDGGSSTFVDGDASSSGSGDSGGGGGGGGNGDSGDSGYVAPTCASDSGICVYGGIVSVGRAADRTGTGTLPDGAAATLTDDGFDLGGRGCDATGTTCVTGAITP